MAFENLIPRLKYTEAQYLNQLRKLLPRGLLWGFDIPAALRSLQDVVFGYVVYQDGSTGDELQDSVFDSTSVSSSTFGLLLSCFAAELERIQQRATDLQRERIPGLSSELLAEWENDLGLPDPCTGPLSDLTERRAAVMAKAFQEYATVTANFLIDYAATLGFVVEVEETASSNQPRRIGVARMGVERIGGLLSHGLVVVRVISGTGNLDQLQCTFQRIKPAHVVLIWE